MGKRDDRLHSPEAFKQALMTRPISRNGFVMVYRISLPEGMRLGFILPRKFIRSAVVRNQIKRWARVAFRQTFHPGNQAVGCKAANSTSSTDTTDVANGNGTMGTIGTVGTNGSTTPAAYVVRIVQKVSKDHWQTIGRSLWKQQFEAVLGAAFVRGVSGSASKEIVRGTDSR